MHKGSKVMHPQTSYVCFRKISRCSVVPCVSVCMCSPFFDKSYTFKRYVYVTYKVAYYPLDNGRICAWKFSLQKFSSQLIYKLL